mgnify:CR=1 FL=1
MKKNLFIRDFARILKEEKEKKSSKNLGSVNIKGGGFPEENVKLLEKEMDEQGFTNPFIRIAILSVCAKERGLKTDPEMSYKRTYSSRIKDIFGSRFKGVDDDKIDKLKKSTKDFFNYVYGGELPEDLKDGWPDKALKAAKKKANVLGNLEGSKGGQKGDGYRFRGMGFNQLTGRYAYKKRGKAIGEDLESDPEKLVDPSISAKVAVGFIKKMMKRKDGRMKFEGEDWQNGYKNQEDANIAAAGANAGFKSNISMALRLTKKKNKHFSYDDMPKGEESKPGKKSEPPKGMEFIGKYKANPKIGLKTGYFKFRQGDFKGDNIVYAYTSDGELKARKGGSGGKYKTVSDSLMSEVKIGEYEISKKDFLKSLSGSPEVAKKAKSIDKKLYSKIEKAMDSGSSAGKKAAEVAKGDEVESKSKIEEHIKNKDEGNEFREWVNDNHEDYAKEIDLDKSGSYKNTYIKKAWKKFGDDYLKFKKKNNFNKDKVEALGKMKPFPKGGLDFPYVKIRQGDKKEKSIVYALSLEDGEVYARSGGSKDKYQKIDESLLREVKVGKFNIDKRDFINNVFSKPEVQQKVKEIDPKLYDEIEVKFKEIKEKDPTSAPGYYNITFDDKGNPSVPAVEDLAKAIKDELGVNVTSLGRGPTRQSRVSFQYPYGLDALVRKYDPSIEPGSYFL